jgi:hypothetical protein
MAPSEFSDERKSVPMRKHHALPGLFIEPKPPVRPAFWIGAPKDGFTRYCAQQCAVTIPLDEMTVSEALIIQRRQTLVATLIAVQKAKARHEIQHANVVSR